MVSISRFWRALPSSCPWIPHVWRGAALQLLGESNGFPFVGDSPILKNIMAIFGYITKISGA